jgi:competence protein ComGC
MKSPMFLLGEIRGFCSFLSVSPNNVKDAGLKTLTEMLESQIEVLEMASKQKAVLTELVRLKDLKDAHGSTSEYERDKEIAWQKARELVG